MDHYYDHCENIKREQEKLIAALEAQLERVRTQLLSPRINLEALEAEIAATKVNFESQKHQMYQNQTYLQRCEKNREEISDQSKNPLAIEAYGRSANPECIPRETSEFVAENFEMSDLSEPAQRKFTFSGKIVPNDWTKHSTEHEEVLNDCSIQLTIRCETGESYNVTAAPCSKLTFKNDPDQQFNRQIFVEFGGNTRQWTLHGQFYIWTQPTQGGVLDFAYSAMMKRKPFIKGHKDQVWTTANLPRRVYKVGIPQPYNNDYSGQMAYEGKCVIHREPATAMNPNEIIRYDISSGPYSPNALSKGDGSKELFFIPNWGLAADPNCKKY